MDLQIFGGSGAGSGRKTGGGGTPSGVNYEEFMKMSEDERYDFMEKIINDSNIVVPNYLDKSITSKVMYGLGMNNKPTVVSDEELDKIKGADLYRLVYESPKSSLTSKEILEQIKFSDYTQLSDKGGSAYGRAIYFANNFESARNYGIKQSNPLIMRVKIKPDAKFVNYNVLEYDTFTDKRLIAIHSRKEIKGPDRIALHAIANGIDGWRVKDMDGQAMILNRGVLIASSVNKQIRDKNKKITETWHDSPHGQ